MIVDFKSWKYQEIFDYIKEFDNKMRCSEPEASRTK